MRYSWTEEQIMLRDMLDRYVADHYDFSTRKDSEAGSDENWRELAELGILGLPFPEEFGGSDGDHFDILVVMESLGRGLAREPFISTVVLGGGLLLHGGSDAQRETMIPAIASGDLRLALAYSEPRSRYNPAHVEAAARAADGGFILDGQKVVVYGAPEAQRLLVTARTSGEPNDEEGISLFLVDQDAVGVSMNSYTTVEGMRAADIRFEGVQLKNEDLVGELGGAFPLVERVLDEAVIALSAEAIGAMETLNLRTAEYCETRSAFGQTLSEFQVLRHRVVDMHVAYETAAASLLNAARALGADPKTRSRLASACKVQVGNEANFVGKNAVQLHGAIGMTDELDVGHYFKKLSIFEALFGGSDWHLRRFLGHSKN